MKFSLLINMKMPINVDIFIVISMESFTLSLIEQENNRSYHVICCLLAGKIRCSAKLSINNSVLVLGIFLKGEIPGLITNHVALSRQ